MRRVREGPILIVEDNSATRAALSSLLNFVGYTTVTTRSAEEALHYLESGGKACLVILDLGLSGMDGATFRRKLLAERRLAAIPVVVYSAHAPAGVPDVIAHVRKSAEPDVLLAAVAKACARPDSPDNGGAGGESA